MRQSYDWWLVIIYLLLVLFGWVNIYAAIHASEPAGILDWGTRSGKQFVWILTAFGLAGLILFIIPPRFWEAGAIPVYLAVLVLLVAVIFLGIEVKGSRSWFAFGPVRFQPAEISKISTSLMLAFLMSRAGYKLHEFKHLLLTAAIIGIPMLVILGESETGSALVYVGFIFMLYREGLSGWVLALIGLAILLFILTLTASPYVSVLVLIGLITFSNVLQSGRFLRWLLTCGVFILLMALLPLGMRSLDKAVHPEAEAVVEAIEEAPESPAEALAITEGLPAEEPAETVSEGGFLDKVLGIDPLYILLVCAALFLPWYAWRAYREKDSFMSLSILAFLAGVALVFSTSFIFNHVLQDHQRKRIEVLLGMKEDPAGVGYNVAQSMIAIGSGGLTGKGYLQGTQTSFGFVPEQSTDFIFCTVGEEWGFMGCFFVIALYVLMIWRIIHDAEHSREHFTRIYGYCVACCLFMHLFINIGMTIGLMPVIGIPLPLMSYGGSSLWAFTVLLFIFIVLDHEERKYF